jgi:hypothetical protein
MTSTKSNPATGDRGAAKELSSTSQTRFPNPNRPPAQDRPVYTVELKPEPNCTNPNYALRRALKALLRHHRLRCTSCSVELREIHDE